MEFPSFDLFVGFDSGCKADCGSLGCVCNLLCPLFFVVPIANNGSVASPLNNKIRWTWIWFSFGSVISVSTDPAWQLQTESQSSIAAFRRQPPLRVHHGDCRLRDTHPCTQLLFLYRRLLWQLQIFTGLWRHALFVKKQPIPRFIPKLHNACI